jgi:hypothetical protein
MAWPKGKPRPAGAGKPKGYKSPATLDKIAAREAARVRITERMNEIIDAQVASAIGINHFFLRDELGQFRRITKVREIEEALNKPGAERGKNFWIFTKDPNSLAARDMLAYAIDKPKEQVQEIKVTGDEEQIALLHKGRERAAKAKEDK